MEAFLLEDPPDRPADGEVRIFAVAAVFSCLPLLHVLEHPRVLLEGVVDPDGEHPVCHLVVPGVFDFRQPPDTPLGDAADLEFPVGGDGLVFDAHAEVRGCGFENLLKVVGERDVVEEEDGPRLQAAVVVERLIRDGPGEAVLFRNLLEHGGAGVSLALPGVARYRDVEAVRVLDRLGRKGHREAFRDGSVADMAPVEGVEEEGERVAGPEDRECLFAVLVARRGRSWCRLLLLCRPLVPGLVHPPELRPALGSSAAGLVVAAGEEGTVRKLNRERAVFMCP